MRRHNINLRSSKFDDRVSSSVSCILYDKSGLSTSVSANFGNVARSMLWCRFLGQFTRRKLCIIKEHAYIAIKLQRQFAVKKVCALNIMRSTSVMHLCFRAIVQSIRVIIVCKNIL